MTESSVLTINSGSSSIRFAVYQSGEPLKRGLYGKVDRIGLSGTNLTFSDPARDQQESRKPPASDLGGPHSQTQHINKGLIHETQHAHS